MGTPLVSVVMPAFNQERFVEEAMRSVLSQTYANLELVVVDDGSSDRTAERAASFDDRVRYVRRENGGASRARNTGVEYARGELIAFCDSDDLQAPERIAVQVGLLQAMPDLAFVASDFSEYDGIHVRTERALHHRWLGPTPHTFAEELEGAFGPGLTARDLRLPVKKEHEDRRVYRGIVPELFASIHFAWVGAMMIRREAFRRAGGFDESLTHYEDWDLGSRIAKHRPVAFLDLPLFAYRLHQHQLTKRTVEVMRSYLAVAEKVWMNDRAFYLRHREVVDRTLGSAHWQLGALAVEKGDWASAEASFRRSLGMNPKQRRAYLDLARAAAMSRIPR